MNAAELLKDIAKKSTGACTSQSADLNNVPQSLRDECMENPSRFIFAMQQETYYIIRLCGKDDQPTVPKIEFQLS